MDRAGHLLKSGMREQDRTMQIFAEEGGEYDKKEIAIALQTWDNCTK